MPLPRPLLEHTATALAAVLEFKHPADAVVSRYLRAHPILGQQDRAFVAETVFAVLRRLRLLETLSAGRDPRRLVLAALTRLRGLSLRELDASLKPSERDWLAELKARAQDDSLAVRCDFPDWLLARLQRQYGDEELLALAHSLHNSAPLDLRVNVQKTEREAVLARLATDGIAARATPYSPVGIRLEGKPQINRHALFLEGAIEIQDEGSQILCQLLAPRRDGGGFLRRRRRQDPGAGSHDARERQAVRLRHIGKTPRGPEAAPGALGSFQCASAMDRERKRCAPEASCGQARPRAGGRALHRPGDAAAQPGSQVAPERSGAGRISGEAGCDPGRGSQAGEAG